MVAPFCSFVFSAAKRAFWFKYAVLPTVAAVVRNDRLLMMCDSNVRVRLSGLSEAGAANQGFLFRFVQHPVYPKMTSLVQQLGS